MIKLIEPAAEHAAAALEYVREFRDERYWISLNRITCIELREQK